MTGSIHKLIHHWLGEQPLLFFLEFAAPDKYQYQYKNVNYPNNNELNWNSENV